MGTGHLRILKLSLAEGQVKIHFLFHESGGTESEEPIGTS